MIMKRVFNHKFKLKILIGFSSACFILFLLYNKYCPPTPRSWDSFNVFFEENFMINETRNEDDPHREVLSSDDVNQLIDLKDFEFRKTHLACEEMNPQPIVIILVHSAPENFKKRETIRETWGQKDVRALLLFIVGLVTSGKVQQKLDRESDLHDDLLQGSFQDSYRNMTYKHAMALKWFVYNCPKAKYLLKTDDDIFVNSPLLLEYLETASLSSQIFCKKASNLVVNRYRNDKWRVSFQEYSGAHFPDYCMGYWIIYPGELVLKLYLEAQRLPYFWIDDVHITGTVASNLHVSIQNADDLILTKSEQKSLLADSTQPNDIPYFFSQYDLSEAKIRKLWKITQDALK